MPVPCSLMSAIGAHSSRLLSHWVSCYVCRRTTQSLSVRAVPACMVVVPGLAVVHILRSSPGLRRAGDRQHRATGLAHDPGGVSACEPFSKSCCIAIAVGHLVSAHPRGWTFGQHCRDQRRVNVEQEEKEEVASRPAAAAEKEVVRGLLSRAFHQPPRNISLHNLLDLQPNSCVSQAVRHLATYAPMHVPAAHQQEQRHHHHKQHMRSHN